MLKKEIGYTDFRNVGICYLSGRISHTVAYGKYNLNFIQEEWTGYFCVLM